MYTIKIDIDGKFPSPHTLREVAYTIDWCKKYNPDVKAHLDVKDYSPLPYLKWNVNRICIVTLNGEEYAMVTWHQPELP